LLLSADLIPIQGSIAVSGETDHRSFTLTQDAHVLLDSQTSGQLNWTLDGPHGNVISSPPASASDAAAKSTSSPLDLVSGNYMLSIQGVANATGTYQFRLLDLTNAATATPEVQPPASTPAALTVGGQLNGQPTPLDLQPPLPAQGASASSTVVAPQSPGAAVTNLQQIVFQPNQAQANSPVAFTAKDGDYTLYVMKDGGAVQLVTGNDVLQVNPIGANPNSTIVGLDQQPAFLDSSDADLANSIMGVPAYGRIQMTDVYAGIDLTFHANAGAIEYDWTVNPGADASNIKLAFIGATRLELDPQGDLVVHTSHGEVTEQAPHLYQDIDGVRHDVAGSFALDGAGIVSLQFGEYDHTRPLVIDPVLGYSTYLGSGGNEVVNSTAVDPKTGDTYVMGTLYPYTQSTAGQPGGDPTAAFLSKYNAQGELSGRTLLAILSTSSSSGLPATTSPTTRSAAAWPSARTAASMRPIKRTRISGR
jgi:hypothetical protein